VDRGSLRKGFTKGTTGGGGKQKLKNVRRHQAVLQRMILDVRASGNLTMERRTITKSAIRRKKDT